MKKRVKRNVFVILFHIISRQFCCNQTLWVWTIFRFIYQFRLRLPRGLDKRNFGLRNLFSLCLTSQRDQRNTRQFYLWHSLIHFLCFIVQLIRTHRCIIYCRNVKRHVDKISITSARYNFDLNCESIMKISNKIKTYRSLNITIIHV